MCIWNICIQIFSDTDTKIVTCTDANNYLSQCTWECRNGEPIVGQITSTCLDNGGSKFGKWSPANPVNQCTGLYFATLSRNERAWSNLKSFMCVTDRKCQPPQIAPQNGAVTCSNENKFLSTCSFTCNPGFYMLTGNSQPVLSGQHSINCGSDGQWSEPPPTCRPISCLPQQK